MYAMIVARGIMLPWEHEHTFLILSFEIVQFHIWYTCPLGQN